MLQWRFGTICACSYFTFGLRWVVSDNGKGKAESCNFWDLVVYCISHLGTESSTRHCSYSTASETHPFQGPMMFHVNFSIVFFVYRYTVFWSFFGGDFFPEKCWGPSFPNGGKGEAQPPEVSKIWGTRELLQRFILQVCTWPLSTACETGPSESGLRLSPEFCVKFVWKREKW